VVISKTRDSTQPDQHDYLLLMKGAPEIIIQHCSTILTAAEEDAEVELTDERRAEFEKAYNTYGEQGRRVIGFAHLTFTAPSDVKFDQEEGNFPLQQLVIWVKGAFQNFKNRQIFIIPFSQLLSHSSSPGVHRRLRHHGPTS